MKFILLFLIGIAHAEVGIPVDQPDSVMAKREAYIAKQNSPEVRAARDVGDEVYHWCKDHNVPKVSEEIWKGQNRFYTFECVEARDRAQCKYGDDDYCPQHEVDEERQNQDEQLGYKTDSM